MAHGVTRDALETALAGAPDARAAFVVSPTYYGLAADVAALAEVAHAHDAALVVDQSWGPHFGFHPDVPPSALRSGADAMITSTHKIVGSLTQSAMLHVSGTGRVDPERLGRTVRLVRSTSPSSLLMASLDAARRQLAVHGEDLLGRTLAGGGAGARGDRRHRGMPRRGRGARRTSRASPPGTRCGSSSTSGTRAARATRWPTPCAEGSDVHVELATHATIVLVLGIRQPVTALERFAHDLAVELRADPAPGGRLGDPPARRRHAPRRRRDAARGLPRRRGERWRSTPPSAACRPRRSPATRPASPRCCRESGSRPRSSSYLRELATAGARLHGASDPEFGTMTVLRGD